MDQSHRRRLILNPLKNYEQAKKLAVADVEGAALCMLWWGGLYGREVVRAPFEGGAGAAAEADWL